MEIVDVYRNDIWGNFVYLGNDEDMSLLIGDVLVRLPDEPLLKAIDHFVFASVGRSNQGLILPANILNGGEAESWLILLDDAMITSRQAEDVRSVIAHEIAHAYLRHDPLANAGDVSIELGASRLAREWGFQGSGTDELRHLRE